MIYLRARWYDPATGQFLSVDPAVTQTGAAYNYAGDNPVDNIDPTGLNWLSDAWNAVTTPARLASDGIGWAWYETGLAGDAQSAADFWANLATSGCSSGFDQIAADVFGPLAELGTRGNIGATALTLGGGLAGCAAGGGAEGGAANSYVNATIGRSIANVETDATAAEFASNLSAEGFTSTTSQDGLAQVFEKDGATYALHNNASSYDGPSADYTAPGASKITLNVGYPSKRSWVARHVSMVGSQAVARCWPGAHGSPGGGEGAGRAGG